jgi:hypothetical protein
MRSLVKQARLVGEERALELPEAQRAEACRGCSGRSRNERLPV